MAAIMRVGLLEMVEFGKRFFGKTVRTGTFTEESAGVADLITTCSGVRISVPFSGTLADLSRVDMSAALA
jgi:hypothetical protein